MIGNRAVLIVCLALSLAVTGCFSRTVSNKDGVVDVEATAVTKRDLEVARQMGAPERVIESMEQGEWLYVSDREAVRYAELAIDYMQETYGQACHAQWSTVPWVLNQKAEVTLVADGGEHDGSVVTVTVSMSEPHEFADNWTAILRAPQYEKTVMDALNQALVDLPQNSWAARVWPNEDPETTDAVSGSVDVYISPAEVKKKEDAEAIRRGEKGPNDIPEEERDYYLERRYPAFGNLVPRDVASRAAKERCDAGYGVGSTGLAVYLDFADAIQRLGRDVVEQKYGNLFQMYQKIVDVDPYENPMMIYPAIHYTMGGLWVDYELQTTIPGLFAAGEANFSDHGANRLGASALMQGLADGYFVLPYTMQNYLADQIYVGKISSDTPEFDQAEKDVRERLDALMAIGQKEQPHHTVDHFHKALGKIMWEYVGMARNTESLTIAQREVADLEKHFWDEVFIPGKVEEFNTELEKAYRLADYFELARLIIADAMHREESCGGHFRTEHQTEDGETLRDDENFMYVGVWEYQGHDVPETMSKEDLKYEYIKIAKRNYK